MARRLSFEGRERDVSFVEWDEPTPGTSGEVETRVRVARPSADGVLLELDGRVLSLSVARVHDGLWVWHRGRARFVPDDEDNGRTARRRAQGGIPNAVTPPMPATVVRILVVKGQVVTKGQGLVVVSAMKMEATLSSPSDGVVRSINTEIGASVRPGDILVDVASDGQPGPDPEPR